MDASVVSQAIKSGQLLWLNFRLYSLIVEPYLVGSDDDGEGVLVGWQLSGGSESGPPNGWKAYPLAEIRDAAVLPERFNLLRKAELPVHLMPRTVRILAVASNARPP